MAAVHAARETLTRGRILEAALRLVDAEGLAALSMRRLGQELGVEAMSLYRHVPNKAALLGGIVELLLEELTLPLPGPIWTERARSLARAYRRLAHAHPEAFGLLVTRDLKTPDALRRLDRLVDVCRDAGFAEAAALDAFTTVAGYATGYALFEIGGFFALARDGGPAPDAAASAPARSEPPLFAPDDTQFEFGLGVILDGLRDRLGDGTSGSLPSDEGRGFR